ncbi:MAG TPA: LPS export ABC transporter periplasmic protein LptC [Chitinivibrionales bacterium]|jgi:LPS export ABC transporter protein LptC|nr:LPS export ABC transporter periplasmic protein LptC [Chitinivibrionales bacterium]
MKASQGNVVCAALAAAVLVSCGPKKESVPVSDALVDHPYQEVDSTAMSYYDGSRLKWRLESKHMKKFLADTGHVLANPVKLNVYDSLGKQIMYVLSDSGITDAPMQVFCVWGNAYVKAENGVRVTSQRLNWNIKNHRVTSDEYVQIKTLKGDILQGKGLDAAEDFSWWKFESNVTGRFPNFKERAEKGDNFY